MEKMTHPLSHPSRCIVLTASSRVIVIGNPDGRQPFHTVGFLSHPIATEEK